MDELLMSLIFSLAILAMIFVIWVVIDLFQKKFSLTEKILWLIVILLAPILGSIVYLLVGRNRG